MATAKKVTTKKVKQSTGKSTAKKTASRKKASYGQMQSFHIAKDQPPFTTFKITRQTVYWVILVSFIVFAQLWIISLQIEVASLVDAQQAQIQGF